VAFGASIGVLPLDMPESVLVRFSGTMQTGITLRDLVNAIPYIIDDNRAMLDCKYSATGA
jgi:aconitate hydratase 2/2-methylisocitrate dehydratase